MLGWGLACQAPSLNWGGSSLFETTNWVNNRAVGYSTLGSVPDEWCKEQLRNDDSIITAIDYPQQDIDSELSSLLETDWTGSTYPATLDDSLEAVALFTTPALPLSTDSQLTPSFAQHSDQYKPEITITCTNAPTCIGAGQLEPLVLPSYSPIPIDPPAISSTPRPDLLPEVGKKQICACKMGCARSFASPKDLRRHYRSKAHTEQAIKSYECRCGYFTPRKDHYRRHLSNISRGKTCAYLKPNFRCICEKGGTKSNQDEVLRVDQRRPVGSA